MRMMVSMNRINTILKIITMGMMDKKMIKRVIIRDRYSSSPQNKIVNINKEDSSRSNNSSSMVIMTLYQ